MDELEIFKNDINSLNESCVFDNSKNVDVDISLDNSILAKNYLLKMLDNKEKEKESKWYDQDEPLKIYPHHVPILDENADSDIDEYNKTDCKFKINLKASFCFRIFEGNDFTHRKEIKSSIKHVQENNLLNSLLENYMVTATIFDKKEKKEKKYNTSKRISSNIIELNLYNTKIFLDFYKNVPNFPYDMKIILKVENFELLHCNNKIITYWNKNEDRIFNSNMLNVKLYVVKTPISRAIFFGEEEFRLSLKFLPLQVNIGQDFINFMTIFIKNIKIEKNTEFEFDIRSLPPFFSEVVVYPIKIQLNYSAKFVDINELKNGNLIEILNIIPITGMGLYLNKILLHGIRGVEPILEAMMSSYMEHIISKQLHNVILSVGLLRPITDLTSDLVDIVLLPVTQYIKDGRIIYGLRKSANKLNALTINIFSKMLYKTKDALILINNTKNKYNIGKKITIFAIPIKENIGKNKSIIKAVPIFFK